jgi:hypothetical protein
MRNKIFKRYNHIIDESNKIIFLFLVLNLLGVNTLQKEESIQCIENRAEKN